MAVPTTPPPVRPVTSVAFAAPERRELPNGVPVYAIDGAAEPILRLEAVFPAGRRHERGRGVSAAAARLMTEGAGGYTGDQIAELVERAGGSLRVRGGYDYITLHFHGLNRYLPDVLPVLRALVDEAAYPEKATANYARTNRQKLLIREEKVDYLADTGLRETYFGPDHPYGYRMTAEAFGALEPEALRAHHARTIAGAQPFLVAAGRIDEGVMGFLTEAFGRTPRAPLADPDTPAPLAARGTVHVPKAGAVQAALRFAGPALPKTHPDYRAFFVLNTILGGYFGSRLMSNIREDKGYTYGIYSGMTHLADGAFFYISSEVGAPVCAAALAEVRTELRRLREDLVPEEELDTVRRYLTGTILGSVDGPFKTADTVRGILQGGLPMDHVQRLVDTIAAVDAVELRELARRHLVEDDLLEYVVGYPEAEGTAAGAAVSPEAATPAPPPAG